MFSKEQKIQIAAAVEKILLDIKHPEMPKEKPLFTLHVEGKEKWSWADIEPNWVFDDGHKIAGVNIHNEITAEKMKAEKKCKTCKWYLGEINNKSLHTYTNCNNPRFYVSNTESKIKPDKNTLVEITDAEGLAMLSVEPEFGCILWESK